MDNNNNQVLVACVLSAVIAQSFSTGFYPRNESTTAAQMLVAIRVKNALAEQGTIFDKISFRNVQENKLKKVIIVEGAKKNGKSVNTPFTIPIPGREESTEVPVIFKAAPNDAANHLEPISSYVIAQLDNVAESEDNAKILHTLQAEVVEKIIQNKFGTVKDVEQLDYGFKISFSQFVVSKENSIIYKKLADSYEGHAFGESFTVCDVSFRLLYWRDNAQEDVLVVNQFTYSDIIAEEARLAKLDKTDEIVILQNKNIELQAAVDAVEAREEKIQAAIDAMEIYQDETQSALDAAESREGEMQVALIAAESRIDEIQAALNAAESRENEMQARALNAEALIERNRQNLLYGIATQQATFVAMHNNTRLVNSIWNNTNQWWEFSQENGGRFAIGVPPPQPIFYQPPIIWGGDYQPNGIVYYHPPTE